jgi:hypothetical protein
MAIINPNMKLLDRYLKCRERAKSLWQKADGVIETTPPDDDTLRGERVYKIVSLQSRADAIARQASKLYRAAYTPYIDTPERTMDALSSAVLFGDVMDAGGILVDGQPARTLYTPTDCGLIWPDPISPAWMAGEEIANNEDALDVIRERRAGKQL